MSFATRNSLVLAVLLALIVAVGEYWTSYRQPAKLRAIEAKIKVVDLELRNTPDLLSQYNLVHAEFDRLESRWNSRSKDIPTQDVTGETYAYLNSVMGSSGRIKVDVQYAGPKQEKQYGYNLYSLRGEAPFSSLHRFIWYLENGRRLFKISKLSLRGIISRDQGTDVPYPAVQFDIEIRAYYTPLVELSSSVAFREAEVAALRTNPFYPLVRADLPPNAEGLVEVDRSELKAVIPGKAFVSDQTGTLRSLSVGDKVYLGYVSKISPEESQVEFTLNKGGVGETYVLKVRFRQSQGEKKK
jgi:hypothetical protein